MQVIKCPNDDEYFDLHTLSGYPYGTSLIVTSNSAYVGKVVQSSTKPTDGFIGRPIHPKETILLHRSTDKYWIKSGPGLYVVQAITETITPFGVVDLSSDMYTGDAEGFRRIRVDSAQTSFFEGREGRLFKELSIPTGGTYVMKVVVAVNTILYKVDMVLSTGTVRLTTKVGGTEGGTFTPLSSVFLKNNMTSRRQPYYTLRNQISEGGTHSAGTTLDVVVVATAGSTAQKTTVGSSPFDERGVAPGTYYFVFTNSANETANGVFHCWWEERADDAFP